jgi:hypothetical protein
MSQQALLHLTILSCRQRPSWQCLINASAEWRAPVRRMSHQALLLLPLRINACAVCFVLIRRTSQAQLHLALLSCRPWASWQDLTNASAKWRAPVCRTNQQARLLLLLFIHACAMCFVPIAG